MPAKKSRQRLIPSKKTRIAAPEPAPWLDKISRGVRGEVRDVAGIMNVPVSFVYTHADQIPGLIRVGKYLRWDLQEVMAWRSNGEKATAEVRK